MLCKPKLKVWKTRTVITFKMINEQSKNNNVNTLSYECISIEDSKNSKIRLNSIYNHGVHFKNIYLYILCYVYVIYVCTLYVKCCK